MNEALENLMVAWRHHLHQIAETGFEEKATSDFVAKTLEDMGLKVHRGIGETGVVASLRVGTGDHAVGIRADMDALNIVENAPHRSYASRTKGKMHACGHDGHMAMVLGAARLLIERRDFNGTVHFVFQPAEEHGLGAKAMMKDGLLQQFPMDAIFGAHNMPGMPQGTFSTCAGGIMASEDNFVIRVKARGTHAARPHMGIDPVVIGAQIILALQTIISRSLDPALPAVISCTEMFSDGIRNAIPSNVTIKGDTRSYSREVQALLENRMREVSEGICKAHGAECEFEYTHEFAPTINSPECVSVAVAAATNIVGPSNVDADVTPLMASEDFGVFLQAIPGNFIFIGNGVSPEAGGVPLHNATYDFNDDILPLGAKYFAEVARLALKANWTIDG